MKKKLNRKLRNVLIAEVIIFLVLFSGIFCCQYFVAENSVSGSLKTALLVLIPLLLYALPMGISIIIRGKFFEGDVESPLKADDKKGEVSDGDRNYTVANLLR